MKPIARRRFITSTFKMGALLPVLAVPSVLLPAPEIKKEYTPDMVPDRVILTVTADPSSSVTVNWRTVNIPGESVVEYAVADAHPEFISHVSRVKADSKAFSFEKITAVNHRVTLKDLQPDTLYVYRAGQESGWSEWMQFRTAQRNLPSARISFIYLGDAQVGIRPLWSRVIRKAYAGMPDAQLIIHAGDLVNRANQDEEWGDWFAAGAYIHGTVPSLMTPGNHEYTHEDGKPHLSVYWKEQFSLPPNGPADELLGGSCYYTDIQGVRFISLNTQMIEEAQTEALITLQKQWLTGVLEHNRQEWTCVIMHHPVFSTKKGRDNKKTRDHLKPVFEQYGVDLVMQGHDHAYARGMEKIETLKKGSHSGTMYIVSVSGSKMYETEPMDWADIIESHVQVYQLITIKDHILSFRAYLATGELLDAFDLVKEKGRQNRLVSRKNNP